MNPTFQVVEETPRGEPSSGWQHPGGDLLLTNRALLEGFRHGQEKALRYIYEALSTEVAQYLAQGVSLRGDGAWERATLRPQDLQAVHQETFIRAFSPAARSAYDGLRPFRAYLLTIARSAAIDFFRSAGKVSRAWLPLDEVAAAIHLETELPNPEEAALGAEVRALVREFLDALEPREHQLAQHRFIDGLSQEDTAAVLGLTRSEVRTRERRLKAAFTEHLLKRGWSE